MIKYSREAMMPAETEAEAIILIRIVNGNGKKQS